MTPETRAVLADAALALSVACRQRGLRGHARQLVRDSWQRLTRYLGGDATAPATTLTDHARYLGLVEGGGPRELAEATLLRAIQECRRLNMPRDEIAAILSRAFLGERV